MRHRERLVVLTRKLEVQRDELALAERELEEWPGIIGRRIGRTPTATSGGVARGRSRRWGSAGDRSRERAVRAQTERRLMEEAVERSWPQLKKKLGSSDRAKPGPSRRPGLWLEARLPSLVSLPAARCPSPTDPFSEAGPYLQHRRLRLRDWRSWRGGAIQVPNVGASCPGPRRGWVRWPPRAWRTRIRPAAVELARRGRDAKRPCESSCGATPRSATPGRDRRCAGNAASFTGARDFDWAADEWGTAGQGTVVAARATSSWGDFRAQAKHHGVRPHVRNMAESFQASKGTPGPTDCSPRSRQVRQAGATSAACSRLRYL
jgi:hypothetical protein